MLDMKFIREQEPETRAGLVRRGFPAEPLDALLRLDVERRRLVTETETLKRQRNTASEEIGKLKKAGQATADKQQAVKAIGDRISGLDARVSASVAISTACWAVSANRRMCMLAMPRGTV